MQIHFDHIHGPALRVLAKALIEIAELQEQQLESSAMPTSDVVLAAQPKKPRKAAGEVTGEVTREVTREVTPAPAPAPAPAVTLEQVRAVCAAKSNSGKAAEVKALLKQFGAAKLTDVDPAKFADLLTAAEAL